MTQSFATNRHVFVSRVLCGSEAEAENWREVSAKVRAELEASDEAAWEPDDVFVSEWLEAGAVNTTVRGMGKRQYTAYDRDRNQFYIYDVPVSHVEARRAMEMRVVTEREGLWPLLRYDETDVWLLPLRVRNHAGSISTGISGVTGFAYSRHRVIAFDVAHYSNGSINENAFVGCSRLEKILNFCHDSLYPRPAMFNNCVALETLELVGMQADVDLHWSPRLSLYSMRLMCERRSGSNPISVTVHAEAFARLTDEVLDLAADKMVTFLTV